MNLYGEIGDASSSLRGPTSSFQYDTELRNYNYFHNLYSIAFISLYQCHFYLEMRYHVQSFTDENLYIIIIQILK